MSHEEREDVAQQIDAFLAGTCGPYDWDGLISEPRPKEEYTRVCDYLSSTSEIYPTKKGWCSEEGVVQLKYFSALLRSNASSDQISQYIESEERKRA
jgi:hypothetical protein